MDDCIFRPLERTSPVPVGVAVVGGGLAGLVAAIHAATSGARVVVFEGAGRPGGRARTDHRHGVAFNRGPHALYDAGAGMSVLGELGIEPAGRRPPTAGRAVFRHRQGSLPVGPGTLMTTRLLRPSSRLAFAKLHARLRRVDARSLDSVSVAEFLDAEVETRRDDLRALVEGLVRLPTFTDAPEIYSAGAAIDQLLLAGSGVRYLHRGWGVLVESLGRVASAAGVEVLCDAPITHVTGGPRRWTAVDARGGEWRAAAVIIAGLGPEAASGLVGIDPASLRDAAGPAVRASCLDLVLEEPPPVHFALDLDDHSYYSVHAPIADLVADGRALVSLARYRRPGTGPDVDRDRASMREFARRMGVSAAMTERYLHDMVVSHGMPLAARGGAAGRPGVDALGRPGLLLAGDWVGPTGVLADASLVSGRAAGRIAARIAEASRAA